MEKTLTIDGRQVAFKSTGAFLLRYKSQFGRDAIQDIYRLKEAINEDAGDDEDKVKDIQKLDLEIGFNLIWTLAKTADPTIPPPMDWLDTFGSFPLQEILPPLVEMIFEAMGATVASKKK